MDFSYKMKKMDFLGKKGVIPKNDDGSYTVCVGALNSFSRNKNAFGDNIFYGQVDFDKIFGKGTPINNMLEGGYLLAEVGHPSMFIYDSKDTSKIVGKLDTQEHLRRLTEISQSNSCGTFTKIWLVPGVKDEENDMDVVAIMANIIPSGPHGEALRRDLETGGVNTCFSIRTFCKNVNVGGKVISYITMPITFDWVNFQGVPVAEKVHSLTVENASTTEMFRLESTGQVSPNLNDARKLLKTMREDKGVATEANAIMVLNDWVRGEEKRTHAEILNVGNVPSYLNI